MAKNRRRPKKKKTPPEQYVQLSEAAQRFSLDMDEESFMRTLRAIVKDDHAAVKGHVKESVKLMEQAQRHTAEALERLSKSTQALERSKKLLRPKKD